MFNYEEDYMFGIISKESCSVTLRTELQTNVDVKKAFHEKVRRNIIICKKFGSSTYFSNLKFDLYFFKTLTFQIQTLTPNADFKLQH